MPVRVAWGHQCCCSCTGSFSILLELTPPFTPPSSHPNPISMQIAVDVQIPACFGGLEGEAVYIGERPSPVPALQSACPRTTREADALTSQHHMHGKTQRAASCWSGWWTLRTRWWHTCKRWARGWRKRLSAHRQNPGGHASPGQFANQEGAGGGLMTDGCAGTHRRSASRVTRCYMASTTSACMTPRSKSQ